MIELLNSIVNLLFLFWLPQAEHVMINYQQSFSRRRRQGWLQDLFRVLGRCSGKAKTSVGWENQRNDDLSTSPHEARRHVQRLQTCDDANCRAPPHVVNICARLALQVHQA